MARASVCVKISEYPPWGVKNCNNVLTGNIFIMELREEFSVCLNNEAPLRVRVCLYKPFYSRERENAKLRGTILSENGKINKT